jgi:hypothetical protein
VGSKEKELTIKEVAAMGGKARAKKLTKEQRRALAMKAITARWAKAAKKEPS